MHYIIIDLEWNQPISHRSAPFRRVGDRLMFEMIQIGAVKLDEQRRMVGSFSRLIAPEHYMKLHPRIQRITGITPEDLAGAPPFLDAWAQFVVWCGDDYVLLTWGGDDISVLHQNISFFKAEGSMPAFYDLQKLYSSLQTEPNHKKGLASAMEVLGIVPSDEHPFHNAVDDAYYTAMVFQRLPDAQAVLGFPEKPREIGKSKKAKQEKMQSQAVRSEASFLNGQHAKVAQCPACGAKLEISEGYVMQRKVWTALADCKQHGLVFCEVAFNRDEEGKLMANRRCYLSDEQSPAYVQTKHLQWAQKVAQRKLQPEEEPA